VNAPTSKRQEIALARVDAKLAVDELARLEATLEALACDPDADKADIARMEEQCKGLKLTLDELLKSLPAPSGIKVAEAARELEVSPTTVRKWLQAGLLQSIPGRKSVEITLFSFSRLQLLLTRYLDFNDSPETSLTWTETLLTALQEQDLQLQDQWQIQGGRTWRDREFLGH
jgi:DNA-binding transcriptional MerR regulator